MAFKTIGLIGRTTKSSVVETLKQLTQFLQKRGVQIVIEDRVSRVLPGHSFQVETRDEMGEHCDLLIAVGGDGSMLSASRVLSEHSVPLLGINRGRLGFLTDISPDNLEEMIGDVLDGHFTIEKRALLDAELYRDGDLIGQADALNDVVVHSGETAQMIEFETFIDDQFVYSQRSDGLILSTPTGSTAYSLSGGGPIMQPSLDALLLVPMFPHTLSSRPIVVNGDSRVKIVLSRNDPLRPLISCDGQVSLKAAPGDVVLVHKKSNPLLLLHPLSHNFYEICRAKLGWGNRLDNSGSR